MKRDPLLYGVIGALIGGMIVWFMATSAVNNNNTGMMQMMGMHGQNQQTSMMKDGDMGMGSSMDDMMDSLQDRAGDDFDQAFISAMIAHHEGAVDMAKEAKINARHDEIKKLADDIIIAQAKEIEMMKSWQKEWGYE